MLRKAFFRTFDTYLPSRNIIAPYIFVTALICIHLPPLRYVTLESVEWPLSQVSLLGEKVKSNNEYATACVSFYYGCLILAICDQSASYTISGFVSTPPHHIIPIIQKLYFTIKKSKAHLLIFKPTATIVINLHLCYYVSPYLVGKIVSSCIVFCVNVIT